MMNLNSLTFEQLQDAEMESCYKMWATAEGSEARATATKEHDAINAALIAKAKELGLI